jgi:hypothetical protein
MVGGKSYVYNNKQRQLYTLFRDLGNTVAGGDHDCFCRITGLVIVNRLKGFDAAKPDAKIEIPPVYEGLVAAIEDCMNGSSHDVLMRQHEEAISFVQTMRSLPDHPSGLLNALCGYMRTESGPAEDSIRNAVHRIDERVRAKRHLYLPSDKIIAVDYATLLATLERKKRI